MRDWRQAVREAARQAAEQEGGQVGYTALNYRWEHVQAVVNTALRLADLLGADRHVVEAAAWLHDVAKNNTNKTEHYHHGHQGAEVAGAILGDTDFPSDKIKAVVDAIVKHVGLINEEPVEPLEAAVLWDADKLTKLGVVGIAHDIPAGLQAGRVSTTHDIVEWIYPPELWPQVVASMNTVPAQRAAQIRLNESGDFAQRLAREWSADDLDDVARPGGYTTGALRQDGRDRAVWSPLWRVRVELTPVERVLLQTWSLRRLHFLHHNGASTFAYPLTVSRLQHTLGVLALVAYFRPDDAALRTAALLHDVGHYPFCHSAELTPGVDHHETTRRRVTSEPIRSILRAHDLEPEPLLALMDGNPPNPLRTRNGLLHLDHLDSWVRQAQAAGFAEMSAHELLTRIGLEGNNVAGDRATAEYLVRLIRRGNERHYAEGDVGPAAVLAHLLSLAQERGLITPDVLADATDDMLLARLSAAGDSRVSELIAILRREPWRIAVRKLPPGQAPSLDHSHDGAFIVELNRLYDDVPLLVGTGRSITEVSTAAKGEMDRVKELAGTFHITWI